MVKNFKRFFKIGLLGVVLLGGVSSETVFATEDVVIQKEETKAEEDRFEARLNYIYVESPYLETPNTQNIVVSWGDGTENITNMSIIVEKDDRTKEEWKSKKDFKQLHLFSKKYNEDVQNEYKVLAIRFRQEGIEQEYSVEDISETSVNFGVNKMYSGYSCEQELLDDGSIENAVEASVVRFDENGELESGNTIEESINETENAITDRERMKKSRVVSTGLDSEFVVLLDPGHDATHSGATANGLKEHELTLKIAKYCKTELEKYSGVKVLMIRTTISCPYAASSSGKCLEKRAETAAKNGADIYVSFHLNASVSNSASGAEVIHPNENWKPEVGNIGKDLAQKIQDELVALGLKDRDIYDKPATNGNYPDGSRQDYFAVQRLNKENGIPGIIIEHAFITNGGDASKFLKTEAGLKRLGVADATGIAEYLKLKKGTWYEYNPARYGDVTVATNLKAKADNDSNNLIKIPKGKRLLLQGYEKRSSEFWYKTTYEDKTGYIAEEDVVFSCQKYAPLKLAKTTANMYMRSDVGLDFLKTAHIKEDSEVVLYGYYRTEGYDWYEIEYKNQRGYVSSKYIEIVGNYKGKPTWIEYDTKKYGDVQSDTKLRKSSDETGEELIVLKAGTRILLDGYDKYTSESWYKTTYDGKTGYVSAEDVKLSYQKYESARKGTTTANMYMRSGVGLDYEKKSHIKSGSEITLYGYYRTEGYDWYYINYNGEKGYVSSKYVKRKEVPTWVEYDTKKYGDVQSDTKLRKSSETSGEVLATLKKRERVLLEGYDKYESGSWYKTTYDGETGYVSAEDVKLSYQKYEPTRKGTTTANLYMRSGVGLNYAKKSYIKAGSEITLYGYYRTEGYDWYYINYNGEKGYVSSKYVKRKEVPTWVGYDTKKYGDVQSDTKLRKSSETNGEVLVTLKKGERVLLEGYDKYKSGSWYKTIYEGEIGYVSAEDVKLSYQKYEPIRKGTTTANLYMRSGVGLNYEKKSYIKADSEIMLYGYYRTEGYDWYYINYNGIKGYVSSKYVIRK